MQNLKKLVLLTGIFNVLNLTVAYGAEINALISSYSEEDGIGYALKNTDKNLFFDPSLCTHLSEEKCFEKFNGGLEARNLNLYSLIPLNDDAERDLRNGVGKTVVLTGSMTYRNLTPTYTTFTVFVRKVSQLVLTD